MGVRLDCVLRRSLVNLFCWVHVKSNSNCCAGFVWKWGHKTPNLATKGRRDWHGRFHSIFLDVFSQSVIWFSENEVSIIPCDCDVHLFTTRIRINESISIHFKPTKCHSSGSCKLINKDLDYLNQIQKYIITKLLSFNLECAPKLHNSLITCITKL